jgi:hypothetical protein
VAYIFEGKQLETYPDEPLKVEAFDTIPLLSKGWTDQPHVRRVGEAWVKPSASVARHADYIHEHAALT